MNYELWTDGSYLHNTNLGTWAYIIKGEKDIQHNESDYNCLDSSKMELTAILRGLKTLEGRRKLKIDVYCDCLSLVEGANELFTTLESRNWEASRSSRKKRKANREKKFNDKTIINVELYKELQSLLKITKNKIKFHWVRSHYGIELNEIVDQLTITTRRQAKQQIKTFEKILGRKVNW